jgi:ribosomal protein L12E/L44/L45/RPP1/RPP2
VLDSIKNKTPDAPSTMLLTNSGKQVDQAAVEDTAVSANVTVDEDKMTVRFTDLKDQVKEDENVDYAYRYNTKHDRTALNRQAKAIAMTREHSEYINAEVKPDLQIGSDMATLDNTQVNLDIKKELCNELDMSDSKVSN